MNDTSLRFNSSAQPFLSWHGTTDPASFTLPSLQAALLNFSEPVVILENNGEHFLSSQPVFSPSPAKFKVLGLALPFSPGAFGDPAFLSTYNLQYPLYAGSMANAISSEALVIAFANAGFLGSFGAGGCTPPRIEKAIHTLQQALTGRPYAFNLINSPFEPALEQKAVDLYLAHGVRVIEASAYLTITKSLARYRASGLSQSSNGQVQISNRVIAKVSRKEVAASFLSPAPDDLLNQLLSEGAITELQASLARLTTMADDITVEADSGGHTDNRPLVVILPAIMRLRDELQERFRYPVPVRIGAAGGIATPAAVLAAFMMGAAYVATGSINQGCVEAGASEHTRSLLAQAELSDVAMAPASDMFEMGVKVQVLKRGTMFAMRGQKLFELYQRYASIDEIPAEERKKLEASIFKQSIDSVWEECVRFFSERDPSQVQRAERNPKEKMALIFRWYLGLSSRWSNIGEKGREMDYQIWCGPAMGAFNDWVRDTYLEQPQNRHAADIALHLIRGAAYLQRLRSLETQGVHFSSMLPGYLPQNSLL